MTGASSLLPWLLRREEAENGSPARTEDEMGSIVPFPVRRVLNDRRAAPPPPEAAQVFILPVVQTVRPSGAAQAVSALPREDS